MQDSKKNLLSSYTYIEICLIPLVDDCHYGYITKLKSKNKIKNPLLESIFKKTKTKPKLSLRERIN
jgi:hypothetical protein